ncbi:hypothetical protein GOP47_0013951 [Adiantum capillus-veneris]|uniref:Uncharacterized protein n=1 Tax=Adiantum capillus-veneris TaxID=13818 RepID=A0A9D4UPH5_ADICA|nr:hypothetical protein GOP47_0013951 [Adiantum capillus-veneris]
MEAGMKECKCLKYALGIMKWQSISLDHITSYDGKNRALHHNGQEPYLNFEKIKDQRDKCPATRMCIGSCARWK